MLEELQIVEQVLATIFSPKETELLARLLLAVILGGAIGYEREKYNKPAGLRTNMLVCLGTALIMVYAESVFPVPDSAARVAAGVITGVGFLGAGSILHTKRMVRGLTTAATIWTVAIIGMTVGGGQYLVGVTATAFVLMILYFSRIEETVVGSDLPVITWLPMKYATLSKKKPLKHEKHRIALKKLLE